MKPFMDADFLLQTDTAKTLYHEAAEKMPIFDYHNHLNPQEILEDRQMENLTRVWLGGDHYKWRAMRAMGFSEDLITGNADDYDKYLAFAETIENAIGNPLYHWTHLELQRYFGITTPLSRATAKEIWDEANAKLQTKEFTVRNLILNQHVSHLCTTDDPADDLHCHLALQKEDFACRVLPSFRPDRAVHLEKPDFPEYVEKLAAAAGRTIASAEDMVHALSCRLDFFLSAGCVVGDEGESHAGERGTATARSKNHIRPIAGHIKLLFRLQPDNRLVQCHVIEHRAKRVIGVGTRGGLFNGF